MFTRVVKCLLVFDGFWDVFGLYWVYVDAGVALVFEFFGCLVVSLFWCVCGDVECLALGGVEVDWFVVLVAELFLDGFV